MTKATEKGYSNVPANSGMHKNSATNKTLQIQTIVTTLCPVMETKPLQMNQLLMKHQSSRTAKYGNNPRELTTTHGNIPRE